MKQNGKKIKNPLLKRIPKELLGDWRKYFVVSLFLILTIGFVSGMYVANESMMTSAEDSVSKYKLEDGHFELGSKADDKLISAIQTGEKNKDLQGQFESDDTDFKPVPVKVYENFYKNEEEDNDNDGVSDGTVRVYAKTNDINMACLMKGKFPNSDDEIAIDRMHADNAKIKVGETVTVGGQAYKVVGLTSYVNYSTLHEKNTDLIFDALKFDVAMVTDDGFKRLSGSSHYAYAWKYDDEPKDETEEKKLSDDFLSALLTQSVAYGNEIKDYIPRYANAAINFATDDMGSDEAMGGVLLDILIVIIAFIFAVTISNTIVKEAQTIGTLRASGYSRGELMRHYLAMPVIITFIAAGIGNILGYSVFKNVVVSMYYNSYSLPTYKTMWNPDAFVKTTLIPVILMFIVNFIVIFKMMKNTPLQFLRRDLKKKRNRKAVRLPKWNFMGRFRMRIILQNIPNYIILFAGIFFIMVMLAMAVGMPDTLKFYKDNAAEMMFAKYQYVLNSYIDETGEIIATDNSEAEQFGMYSLQKVSEEIDEEISVYGILDDSKYVKINDMKSLKENEVYISESFSDKYGYKEGDEISLDEKYEHKTHKFKVKGIYEKCQNLTVFMPIQNYRTEFGLDDGEFSGYMSGTEITDIDEEKIATVITERDITKMCDQLDHSMGSYMQYFQILCVLLSAVLIYLLTKIIIEKNENSISMVKILGYENGEIAKLYLLSTTMILIIADIISVALGTLVMNEAWKAIMFSYSGWFSFMVEPVGYLKMFLFVLVGYMFVMLLDFRRIKKIPMDEALKNVE